MAGVFKGVLNVERAANAEYEWVITAIDSTVATMPETQRSSKTYLTEDEARREGEIALAEWRSE